MEVGAANRMADGAGGPLHKGSPEAWRVHRRPPPEVGTARDGIACGCSRTPHPHKDGYESDVTGIPSRSDHSAFTPVGSSTSLAASASMRSIAGM